MCVRFGVALPVLLVKSVVIKRCLAHCRERIFLRITTLDAILGAFEPHILRPYFYALISVGLCISNGNSAAKNHLIRVQFNPTVEQFRTALREAFAYALNTGRTSESDPSVDGRVSVIYTGQVIAHTGEWLLADSALAGHQVHSWLDSQAAMVSDSTLPTNDLMLTEVTSLVSLLTSLSGQGHLLVLCW